MQTFQEMLRNCEYKNLPSRSITCFQDISIQPSCWQDWPDGRGNLCVQHSGNPNCTLELQTPARLAHLSALILRRTTSTDKWYMVDINLNGFMSLYCCLVWWLRMRHTLLLSIILVARKPYHLIHHPSLYLSKSFVLLRAWSYQS